MEENRAYKKLGSIQRVQVPPFLYTRIQARIEAMEAARVPVKWVVSTALALALLAALNIASMSGSQVRSRQDSLEIIASSLEMTTSNQLYNE